MSDFGKRVRKRREHLGMSQDELALLLGYSDKSSISKIENSQRDIYRGKVVEFAEALKTTPSYLMGWTMMFLAIIFSKSPRVKFLIGMSTVAFLNMLRKIFRYC